MEGFKRILSLLLVVLMLIPAFTTISFADGNEGVCGDNLTWRFSLASGVLTILGEGEMYDYRSVESPWEKYASDIKSVVLGSGITSIGQEAFDGCTELVSVNFPSTLTKINNYAFAWCTSLKSVVIPDNVTDLEYGVFYHCTSLEKAVIGEGVTEIKYYTFNDCTALYDVQFPDSIEVIGEEAFYGCSSYENIVLPDHYVALSYSSFMGTGFYKNPDNWNSDGELYLGDYLLYIKNSKQDTVIVKPGTRYIAEYAMVDLNELWYVYYPRSVEKINGELFYLYDPGATHVDYEVPHAFGYRGSDYYGGTWNISPVSGSCGKNVQFEFDETGTVLTIFGSGDMTTYDYMYHDYFSSFLGTPWEWVDVYVDELILDGNITNLNGLPRTRKLTLGEDLKEIDTYTINGYKTEEIVADENNTVFSTDDGILYRKDMKTLIKYPRSKAGEHFDVPSYVTTIYYSAFVSLNNLKTLYIPETVTEIEKGAITKNSGVTIQCRLNSAAHIYAKANDVPYEIICEHTFSDYTVTEPTCTEDGYSFALCDKGCGATDKIIDEGSATGHSFVNYTYNYDASCTEDGTATALCENGCLTEDTRTEVGSALGHLFTDYTVIITADCTHDETSEAFCDRGCGERSVLALEGSAWGHSFTEYVDDNNTDCIHDGTETAVCDNGCGASDTRVIEGSAIGHLFTDYTVVSELSCTVDGVKEAYCDRGCGEKDVITEKAQGHTLGEWIVIEEATYDFEGCKIQSCTVCSEVINTEMIPMLIYEGFPDVPESAWYHEGVEYCFKQGYILGNDKGRFDPDGTLTREQLVTILARASGAKLSEYTVSPFTDVKADSWYGPAVIWASEEGIVSGIGNGAFGVGQPISREQLAVMLYRYAQTKGINVDQKADLSYCNDADRISDWAKDACAWAVKAKLLGSTSQSANLLSPKMTVTRAQAAKIFMSYDNIQ